MDAGSISATRDAVTAADTSTADALLEEVAVVATVAAARLAPEGAGAVDGCATLVTCAAGPKKDFIADFLAAAAAAADGASAAVTAVVAAAFDDDRDLDSSVSETALAFADGSNFAEAEEDDDVDEADPCCFETVLDAALCAAPLALALRETELDDDEEEEEDEEDDDSMEKADAAPA